MSDHYKNRLKNAQTSWMEHKCDACRHFLGRPRRKDRKSSRAEKRRARILERRDRSGEE